ncbi:hypothetical protein [Calothrix sp. UHCC 0171]|uniref:hypothetical protein n=1 Tax=Calothrix sp. UHCC 0171 TaxID=3110245 RepID=UPI002B207918|nr:hypothetical protein [Calothrix sp. UHCC 0171]MEA5569700.1 hypothetical protein [Calothrix sp. UHCC 0171]
MTSRATEIQTLIAEIDNLLANKGKRLSRVLSNQGQEPKQVLERIRSFLVNLEENKPQAGNAAQLTPLIARYIGSDEESLPQQNQSAVEGASVGYFMGEDDSFGGSLTQHSSLQTSSQLNNHSREISAFIEPLQAELQSLLEERKNLVEEIRQLEQQRLHNYSLVQQMATQEKAIAEFLQVLANRVGENPAQAANLVSVLKSTSPVSLGAIPAESEEQVERLSQLASELDQKLIALDGTVNIVFEALQRNVHTYHNSLSDALMRMHDKGSQGEKLLNKFIDDLVQQLHSLPTTATNSGFKKTQELPSGITKLDRTTSRLGKVSPSASKTGKLPTPNITELPDVEPGLLDDSNAMPDLDALLLELSQDTTPQQSLESPQTSQQQADVFSQQGLDQVPQDQVSQDRTDEVDRLYASLFVRDDVNNLSQPIAPNQLTRNPIAVTQDLSTPNIVSDASETIFSSTSPEVITPELDNSNLEQINLDLNLDLSIDTNKQADNQEVDQVDSVPQQEILLTDQENTNDETIILDFSDVTPQETIRDVISSSEIVNTQEITAAITTPSESISPSPNITEILPATPELDTVTPSVNIESASTENLDSIEKKDVVTGFITDPWFDGTDAGLSELQDLQSQNLDSTVSEQTPDVWQAFVNTEAIANTARNLEEPVANDIITALTDLIFADEDNAAIDTQLLTDTSTSISKNEPQSATENPTTSENLTANYITASPQEILLSKAMAEIDAAMPDISLDEGQLQQLDQDLANFDSEHHIFASTPTEEVEEVQPDIISPTPSEPEIHIPQEASVVNADLDLTSTEALVTEQPTLEEETEVKVEESQNTEITANHSPTDTNNLTIISDSTDNPEPPINAQNSAWYLGIDLGTTGISAALLNRSTAEVYPLYWSADSDNSANGVKRSFRLPAEVYLPASVGIPIGDKDRHDTTSTASPPNPQNLFSAELKPYLQVALAYRSLQEAPDNSPETSPEQPTQPTFKWEPVLQLNEVATVPLVWMVRSLSKLLLTLKSDRNSTTLGLTAIAMGLNPQDFSNVIDNLAGVICSCPSNWSEQYRFNIREALLISKIITHPQQVFFVEEAIATLLSELDGCNGEEVKLKSRTGSRPAKSSDHPLLGNTLIMNIGASSTEMALVDIPDNLIELTHSDFMLHSFAYGGKSIEQDIVCQLLLPPKWRQAHASKEGDKETVSSNPVHWQSSIPGLEKMQLSSLGWEELTLPRPGEPDTNERIRLQQRLESSLLGQALLDAATAMKLILQQQESFSLRLADQSWTLQRRDLESQVFVPFVRRLNRELNRLLVARGIPTEAINQAILTGGVASLGAVSRWLRQKLPNARIIQDLYLGDNGVPACSRVAYGLCLLPLHPQVLEIPRQQYTDYFLFTELLKVLPEQALSFSEVLQLFEERGINTRSCQQRLLAFLEGELPGGLVPNSIDSLWLQQSSVDNPDYKAIASTPLFEKQGSLSYRSHHQQIQELRRYLDAVKSSTQQSLEEPYTVNFAVGVRE